MPPQSFRAIAGASVPGRQDCGVVDYQPEGNRSFARSLSAKFFAFAGNVVDELDERIKKGPDFGAFF
jgi:hypothetical protein